MRARGTACGVCEARWWKWRMDKDLSLTSDQNSNMCYATHIKVTTGTHESMARAVGHVM
jgi:hypothetical protein